MDKRIAERMKRRQPPGAYPCVERSRGGGTITRFRTHMGQLCRADTTPAEAVAMWEARQQKIRLATPIGRTRAARLGALLTPEHRTEYEQMLVGQRCGVTRLVEWLAAHGYRVSVPTVQAHRDQFLVSLLDVQQSARLAAAFASAAREQSPGAIVDAAAGRTEQLFMEMLFDMKPDERRALTVKDWVELQKASGGLVAGRRAIERLRAEFEDRARRAAMELVGADGKPKPGPPGLKVCNRVREILGIPQLDENGNEVDDLADPL
jgi:hypothetical protein